jgi:transposase
MSDYSIYEGLLGLGSDWSVSDVSLDKSAGILHITSVYKHSFRADKDTGEVFPIFDFRTERSWRHLDCMEFKTHVHCRLPRIKTSDGRVHTIEYDWAESGFSYTKKFENKCIEVLQFTHNRKGASALMRVSDDKICGVMHSAVERGLSVRDLSKVSQISLDEKSYKRGHQYISVLTDSSTGAILDVEQGRTEIAADNLLRRTLSPERLSCIVSTCCDMWEPFIKALKKTVRMPNLFTTSFTLSST